MSWSRFGGDDEPMTVAGRKVPVRLVQAQDDIVSPRTQFLRQIPRDDTYAWMLQHKDDFTDEQIGWLMKGAPGVAHEFVKHWHTRFTPELIDWVLVNFYRSGYRKMTDLTSQQIDELIQYSKPPTGDARRTARFLAELYWGKLTPTQTDWVRQALPANTI